MMKFSVITPTMWMANEFFLPMLKLLNDCEEVGEIIIIDNNPKVRPQHDVLNHQKVTLLDFGKNIYYNKSMNIGAKEAKFEFLALMNDDVIFDPFVFKVLTTSFTNNSELKKIVGMIYPHPQFFNKFEKHQELAKDLKLAECIDRLDGFGCCMFVLKQHYTPIPEELVQHFGDVWLHKMQIKEGRKNYWLYNWVLGTEMRTTTKKVSEIRDIILNDWKIAQNVFTKHNVELEDHSNIQPLI